MTTIKDAEKEAVLRVIAGIRCLSKFSNYNIGWGIINSTVYVLFECPGLPYIIVNVPIDIFTHDPLAERLVCELFQSKLIMAESKCREESKEACLKEIERAKENIDDTA